MEIKTAEQICNNAEEQEEMFGDSVWSQKWVSEGDLNEELQNHSSCPFPDGRCKLGPYKHCVSNIKEKLEELNAENIKE